MSIKSNYSVYQYALGSGLRLVGGVQCQNSDDEVHAQIVIYKNGPDEKATLRNGV